MNYEENKDYSTYLERAVIGACLLENSAPARVYGLIKPEHFYGIETKNAATAIWQMFETGLPIDLHTVLHFLMNNMGLFHLSGYGKLYDFDTTDIPFQLTRLTNDVVSSAHIEYHAFILKQLFLNREIKRITSGSGMNLSTNPQDDLKILYSELNRLNENVQEDGWLKMDDLMVKLYQHQDEMIKNQGKGLQTGFSILDELNGGFFPGNTIVIGARPSVGKSAFAGQIALNVAMQGKHVGIISLEMNNNEISARIAAIDTNIDFGKLYRSLFDDERQRDGFYTRVNSYTSKLPIWVSDKTGVRATDIRAKAAVLKARHGLDLLIIDYLQLISTDNNKNKNRENEVSEISKACKIMAKELECPVIELCQLSRAVTARKGQSRYPQLSDLRESGSIEQDADVVMFIHRDWLNGDLVNEDGTSTEFDADLIIGKWRNGKLGHIRMDFIGSKMMFKEKGGNGFRMYIPENDHSQDVNPF